MQNQPSDDFEIIVSDNIESLKNELAQLYNKNELQAKELSTKEQQIQELTQQIVQYKKKDSQLSLANNLKSSDCKNELEMKEFEEIDKLRKNLQSLQQQNLKKENATQIEKENALLNQQNIKLSDEIKQLRDKLSASELKVKQQVNKIKEKEEVNLIYNQFNEKDIEAQKNQEISQKIKEFQKQKDQEIEILKATQKKLIQQYEKKLGDQKLTSQIFFNDQNKINPMETIFQEISQLLQKHIDDIEGRRQVIDYVDKNTNLQDLYKKDLKEVQNSLVQINNFLKNTA